MKKIMMIVWLCILCAPTMLMLSTSVEGSVTWLNVVGIVYTVILCKNWRQMMPEYMSRYILCFIVPK